VLCHSCFLSSFINSLNSFGCCSSCHKSTAKQLWSQGICRDVQWHSKLLWNMHEKNRMFGEGVGWSCPCHPPPPMINISCNQRVFIAVNPRRIPLHMQLTCGKCLYVLACTTDLHHSYHRCIQWYYPGQCKFISIYGYGDILNTYAPWVYWHSIWLWHMQHPWCLSHKELLRHQYLLEDCYLVLY